MNLENIKHILNSDSGEELLQYLLNEVDKLNRIENLKISLNPITTTIEIRATQKAHKRLTEILSPLLNWSRSEKKKDERDSYEV